MTTTIHSIESMAALDGEGIRYGVFFTGCPLRCVYCHNPDTWFGTGTEYTAEALAKKIKRYKPYFKNGGGVTFSGGEPLLNAEFINEISPLLKAEDIGYCLDTSGSVPLTDTVKACIDNADMVILDIKFYNEADYKNTQAAILKTLLQSADTVPKQASACGCAPWLCPTSTTAKTKYANIKNLQISSITRNTNCSPFTRWDFLNMKI